MKFGPIIPFVTLIVTAVGWFITYRFQKKILEKQIEAEQRRDFKLFTVPRRIKNLENLMHWIQRGQQLILKLPEGYPDSVSFEQFNPEMQKDLEEWNSHAWSYENWLRSEGLIGLIDLLRKFIIMIPSQGMAYDTSLAIEEGSELIPAILKAIEELIEQEANKGIGDVH